MVGTEGAIGSSALDTTSKGSVKLLVEGTCEGVTAGFTFASFAGLFLFS